MSALSPQELTHQLEQLPLGDYVVHHCYQLLEKWKSLGVGIEAVVPILRFIEEHPNSDLGTPGPLVHFVERFAGRYEDELLASRRRRPTSHTVWMLNRVLNDARSPKERQRWVEAMKQVLAHPLADEAAKEEAEQHLA